jgi:hypothetical protein
MVLMRVGCINHPQLSLGYRILPTNLLPLCTKAELTLGQMLAKMAVKTNAGEGAILLRVLVH